MKTLKDYIGYILVSIFSILTPIKEISLTLVLLILTDFLFGIYRAKRQGEEITSRKMSKSVVKILFYNIVILLLYYTNNYIFETGLPLEKMAASLICLVELRSIDESWKIIYGWSLWGRLSEMVDKGVNKSKIIK